VATALSRTVFSTASRAREARRAGASAHARAPRVDGADCRRRTVRSQLAGRQGDRDAPGAGCLPLALRATSAPARTQPRGRPHRQLAATSVVARGAAKPTPSLRRRILKPCEFAVKSARCARVAARSLRDPGLRPRQVRWFTPLASSSPVDSTCGTPPHDLATAEAAQQHSATTPPRFPRSIGEQRPTSHS
jgi:hypothetical protein